jgi:DnaK suppressor protein
MDTATARRRLEEMCGELDKSILVLKGEHPSRQGRADSPQDPADAGTTLSEADRTEAVLAVALFQRTAVLEALGRIECGTYGLCADCRAPIPDGRLDARPEATRCVTCQSKRDRGRR